MRICVHCGKPAQETEFYTAGSERRYIHFECLMQNGQEAIESGKHDDLQIVSDL